MDKPKFLAALARTPHFVLYAVAVVVYSLHIGSDAGWISLPPHYSGILATIGVGLGTLGYGLGAAWSPPRKPWTDAERAAKGLPPANPPAPGP